MMQALLDYLWHYLWQRPTCALTGTRPRSPKWPNARRAWLAKHPRCEATGCLEEVEVHHIEPFHERPALELDETNFISLRRDVHLLLGHLDNWKSHNPSVVNDARKLRAKIDSRP